MEAGVEIKEYKNTELPISEVFVSIQGEGPTAGRLAVFIRLAGCNLMCGGQGTQFDKQLHNGATWRCDTVEVWMKGKNTKIMDILNSRAYEYVKKGAHVIITGGEPLIHGKKLEVLTHFLTHQLDAYIEVETNGTIEPGGDLVNHVNQWNVSPKLANSGNDEYLRFNQHAWNKFQSLNAVFKFVVSGIGDAVEIEKTFQQQEPINWRRVYFMPAGESQKELLKTRPMAAELAIEYGANYSDRMHIVIWNQKTGV